MRTIAGRYDRSVCPRVARLLGALVALPLLIGAARADSLFPIQKVKQLQRGSSAGSIATFYSDTRAHEVGDVLTVTIAENTTASSTANTKTSQDDNVNAFGGTGLVNSFFKSLALSATN